MQDADKMLRLCVLGVFVLVCSVWWGCANSQSGSGAAGYRCTDAPIELSSSNINVIFGVSGGPGTVCFVCVIGGEVATDATFTVNNLWPGTSSNWTVVNDTLVVFDTESVFLHDTFTRVRCFRDDDGNQLVIFVAISIFKPPVIVGEPYVSDGSDLVLDCDTTNSRPETFLRWVSPSGEALTRSRYLHIMNITRGMAGVYTCVADQYQYGITGTMNTTVTIIVQYFNPPVITGETNITKGDTLDLYCNVTTSNPLPSVQWLSPDGKLISDRNRLHTTNTASDKAGTYTCLATQSNATMNSTVMVNIHVNFECEALQSTDTMTVNITSTAYSSTATYRCKDDLSVVYTSQCTGNGAWDPDPLTTPNCTLPKSVECEALQSTDTVTVNITSTALGSTATYRCKDDLSVVYTSQCTGNGAWDPDPLTTPNCTLPKSDTSAPYSVTALVVTITVTLLVLLVISIATIVVAVLIWKRDRESKTGAKSTEKSNRVEISTTAGWANTSLELQQLTESNGPYSDVVKQEMLTTNDHKEQCSLDPSETQNCLQSHGHSNGELMTDLGPSVHHGEVQKPTELTGQCSTTESGSNPQQAQLYTANPEQLSDVRQGRAEQTSPFSEQGSVVPSSLELKAVHQQDKQQETKNVGINDTPSSSPSTPPPPHSVTAPVKNVIYAELQPQLRAAAPHQALDLTDRVQYASLVHNTGVKLLPTADHHDPDANVGLDQILIQLKEVAPQWRSLAETAGLDHDTLDRISEYATSESEAMVEVVDGWLAKLYPNKPTWREIADVVESIGHGSLADSIREVYTTGVLPKETSNAVPDNILSLQIEAPPPPLPPRSPNNDRDTPPPPLPVKPIT